MANICDLNEKPKIQYPTFWEYKIIIEKFQDAKKITEQIVQKREHRLIFSKHSKDGKYASYSLSVLVKCDEERLEIFSALRHICKFVL
ncbi:MAG: HP0495 family protein [Campylobacter sp.]